MFRFLLEKVNPAAFLQAAKSASTSVSAHTQKLLDLARLDSEQVLRDLGVTECGLNSS